MSVDRFITGALVFCGIVLFALCLVAIGSGDSAYERIKKIEPCETEVEEARNPAEICTMWEQDRIMVVGPRWLAGE